VGVSLSEPGNGLVGLGTLFINNKINAAQIVLAGYKENREYRNKLTRFKLDTAVAKHLPLIY
jgi:hypothetical protein